MIIDTAWTGGFVVGIQYTDEAVVGTDENEFQFCSCIMIHLGFFTVAFLFT